jgi:hypothetical protein
MWQETRDKKIYAELLTLSEYEKQLDGAVFAAQDGVQMRIHMRDGNAGFLASAEERTEATRTPTDRCGDARRVPHLPSTGTQVLQISRQ